MLQSTLLSQVPGLRHGFTTRAGGISEGPYASLNLGLTFGGGDDPRKVEENLRLVAAHLGAASISSVDQVHGVDIVPHARASKAVPADGILIENKGQFGLVTVADCAPVLVARRDGKAACAVHAGWRGAVGRIASLAVARLGTQDVVVAVGPCIGPCCFEVGSEVVAAVLQVAGEGAILRFEGRKPHVDLAAVVQADLVSAGVPPRAIEVISRCTRCHADLFSHRRDKGVTGRQAGVLGLEGP